MKGSDHTIFTTGQMGIPRFDLTGEKGNYHGCWQRNRHWTRHRAHLCGIWS